MQDCTPYEINLGAYAAGELNEPDLRILQNHLLLCGDCRDELAREMEMRAVLASLPEVSCPESVSTFVEQAIPSGRTQVSRQIIPITGRANWWSGGLGLVAAALLAVLLVPGLFDATDSSVPVAAIDASVVHQYSKTEIAQARQDVIMTLAMAADVLGRSREQAVVDVFGSRLPQAISNSLRPFASDAQNSRDNPNPTHSGGDG